MSKHLQKDSTNEEIAQNHRLDAVVVFSHTGRF